MIEVAKWRFLQGHVGRERPPRGFTDGIELKLTGVEDGSAIPVITLFLTSLNLPGPGMAPSNQVYFEEARESIIGAIDAAEHGQSVAPHLPEECLGYFDRIGRSLRDGESIEFTSPLPAPLMQPISAPTKAESAGPSAGDQTTSAAPPLRRPTRAQEHGLLDENPLRR